MAIRRHLATDIDRREFLRRAAALAGGSAFLGVAGLGCGKKEDGSTSTASGGGGGRSIASALAASLVLVKNGPADELVAAAFDRLGGIDRIVKAGDKVCLKPNAAWARMPGSGACTHVDIMTALIDLLLGTGVSPSDIVVFEHTRDAFPTAMAWSGIEQVCADTGIAAPVSGDSQAVYEEVDPPEGTVVLGPKGEKEQVAYEVRRADVVINLPVLKNHSATGLSLGMKNMMGAIYNPRRYHSEGDADAGSDELDERIADLTMLLKPNITLTMMDATYVLREDGPKGPEGGTGDQLDTLIVGVDPVAVDALGAHVFGMDPADVGHIAVAGERGLGEIDVETILSASSYAEVDLGGDAGGPPPEEEAAEEPEGEPETPEDQDTDSAAPAEDEDAQGEAS